MYNLWYKLVIKNRIIEEIMQIVHLGTRRPSNNSADEQIEQKFKKARRIPRCMNILIWDSNTSHKKEKLGFTKARYVQ